MSKSKKRPAVVVKNLEGQNIIVCQMTTRKHALAKYEVSLKREHCNGDIRFDSFVYLDLIVTLHRSLITKKVGVVKDEKVKKEISEKLATLFDD